MLTRSGGHKRRICSRSDKRDHLHDQSPGDDRSLDRAAAPCQYLSDHLAQFEYLRVATMQPREYMAYLLAGWRRFGHTVFRQTCSGPNACRSLRVNVARFHPDRNQRRNRKANERVVVLRIGTPAHSPEKLALFARFHAERSQTRGWLPYEFADLAEFTRSFVRKPIPHPGMVLLPQR